MNISRKELNIAPQDFRSMADSTRLTLWLAEEVIRESGLLDSGIPRERIGVLVSQNSGETADTIKDLVFDVYHHEIIDTLQDFVPMTPDQVTAFGERINTDMIWYPRSQKVSFKGLGVMGRIEPLEYYDGEV